MNEELRVALELVGDLHYQRGANNARGIVCAPPNADILAAEAAVVAIFEAREDPQLLTAVHMMGAAEAGAELREMKTLAKQLAEALKDMKAGWEYIRKNHGDLYGVGWERCAKSSDASLVAYAALEARG
jgi:hypothetical protein